MNLIKIGTRIVNLDTVTNVDTDYLNSADRRGIRVYFGAESETFYGIEAAALKSWLESMATDVIEVHTAELRQLTYVAQANARTCATCGGEGDCPDCGPLDENDPTRFF